MKWSSSTVRQPVTANGSLAGVGSHSGVPARAPPHEPWANAAMGFNAAATPIACSSWRREISPLSNALKSRVSSVLTGRSFNKCVPESIRPAAGCHYHERMAVSDSYLAYVLEQLDAVRGVVTKRMFGGVGIYSDDVFFAVIDNDTLFFKVD